MKIRETIVKILLKETGVDNIQLVFADKPEHGDYTTNIAMQSGKNPREFASELLKRLETNESIKEIISKIEIAGPGFINFYLKDKVVLEGLNTALSEKGNFGKEKNTPDNKVIVEYSSPNIAKPFNIGHFRSTIIGDAVANLLTFQGFTVFRDNHLGDWGTQFGKQIYAIKTWGNEEQIEKSDNPVKELVSLYIKFHEEAEKDSTLDDKGRAWFKKLEEGDAEAKRIWQKCIDWSFLEFDKIYKKLGVVFTENNGRGYGESFFEDKMQIVLEELVEKQMLRNGEEGAQLVFFDNEKYPPLMVVKKDGASLYATRDLAADKWRFLNYGKDVTIINEVGGDQALYFQQLYEVEKILGWVKSGQRVHLKHGLFRFKDKKMSTRKGNVIWLEEVLHEAFEKAKLLSSENSESAETISIGALKWNELKRDPISDIIFDWDEILNMKGNSGPYMQYTVVRIRSLLSKSEILISPVNLISEEDSLLAHKLIQFPEVVNFAANKYQPAYLAEYLYSLAQTFNTFYDSNRIIGNDREAEFLSISKAVEIVLTNGLSLLGIEVPEKM